MRLHLATGGVAAPSGRLFATLAVRPPAMQSAHRQGCYQAKWKPPPSGWGEELLPVSARNPRLPTLGSTVLRPFTAEERSLPIWSPRIPSRFVSIPSHDPINGGVPVKEVPSLAETWRTSSSAFGASS
jgi:hypothetical protein